jgi:hypothetical protein
MARFFFDVSNNGTLVVDEVGLDLNGATVAVGEAASALAEMADEMFTSSLRQQVLSVEIRGELGTAALRLTLALEVIGTVPSAHESGPSN